MDAIETAVRNAFAKGDTSDPAFRERVYRAAFSATERAIEANPNLTAEAIEARRAGVNATIEQIEAEFTPPTAVEPRPALVADAGPREAAFHPHVQAPQVEGDMRGQTAASYVEPRIDPPGAARADERAIGVDAADIDGRRRSRRGGFVSRLLPVVVVLLLASAGAWWALSSGFFTAPIETAEAPPAVVDDTPPTGGTEGPLLPRAEDTRDWVTIFSPGDPTQAVAPAGASAEVLEDDGDRFLRIRSGAEGSPVRFDIGPGVLERLAGGRAVFNIVARAEEGMPTEIAVECDFGALGDCGRKRYAVNYERGDYLFEVDLADAQAGGPGAIAITSDVDNEGKALDVFEIRVSTPE